MEYLQPSLLIAGGLLVLAPIVLKRVSARHREAMLPLHAFFAVALFVTAASWLIKGPLRIITGPPLVLVTVVGLSYGALAAGGCLAFPRHAPKPLQALIATLCVAAGVLLLLLRFRVIRPT